MRMTLVSIGLGVLLGLTAEPPASGNHCGHLTMTHVSQITSCGADFEDMAVDKIKNNDSSSMFVCIVVEQPNNIVTSTIQFEPAQCNTHAANEEIEYSIFADRVVRCSDDTASGTDKAVGGSDCTSGTYDHNHSFPTECCQ